MLCYEMVERLDMVERVHMVERGDMVERLYCVWVERLEVSGRTDTTLIPYILLDICQYMCVVTCDEGDRHGTQ